MPVVLTSENFAAETAAGLTVVDFWAAWCGPCKLLAPIVEELAGELPDVKFAKVNVDEQPELARQYRVDAIPTLYFLRDGKVVSRSVGLVQKPALRRLIDEARTK